MIHTKFHCECCGWVGTSPTVICISNPIDVDDETVYEGIICPECNEYSISELEEGDVLC